MKSKTQFKQLLLLLLVFTFSARITFGQNCGDINADGSTDIVDALLVAQCYVSLISCPSAEIGDVNCDGSIDIVDGLLIAQLYVGLVSTLNCCNIPTEIPTPEPTPFILEFQAETEATWDGGSVEKDNPGYTGSGYVNFANSVGLWIQWTVNVESARNAECVFRYANSGSGRPMDLSINGSVITSLSFSDTGAWTSWSTQTADMILDTGLNEIRLTATSSGGGPNIDKMDIILLDFIEGPCQATLTIGSLVSQVQVGETLVLRLGFYTTPHAGVGIPSLSLVTESADPPLFDVLPSSFPEVSLRALREGSTTVTVMVAAELHCLIGGMWEPSGFHVYSNTSEEIIVSGFTIP